MLLLITSFFAGVLTSLAPCILPLLPVIVGSSILSDGDAKQDKWKPYIITASLALSVIVFTLLLKVSSILIGLDPNVLTIGSGGIVILIGISMLFPQLWARISAKVGLEHSSNSFLSKANKRSGLFGAILTGVALGPVFSSCSPVYALLLATVLPVNLGLGIVYIISFALGLGLALLGIALLGKRITTRIRWAVDPEGSFRKVLAIILIAVGLLVASGNIQKLQVWAAEHLPFGISSLEQKLVTSSTAPVTNNSTAVPQDKKVYNVKPYAAPELQGIADWINSDPTTLAQLKGKVVLIDFWTYSCINCQRTQPYLNKWYDKYMTQGFEIIGVHAPEFAFEKVPANVKNAVAEAKIRYPVALDNDFRTWGAYQNKFWPAKYLIDKDGYIRYTHFGEGEYDETERVIQDLLKEAGQKVNVNIEKTTSESNVRQGQSPETYLGYERGDRFANVSEFVADKPVSYNLASQLKSNEWSLGGNWQIAASQTTSVTDNAKLRFMFNAKEVYLVMDGTSDKKVSVSLNGTPVSTSNAQGSDVDGNSMVQLGTARLYKLIKLSEFRKDQLLEITVPKGVTVNAFTFGS